MQRIFDLIFSGLALLILSPLLIPLVIILRVTGEGEIFFPQIRIGQGGKSFKLYKFATMLKDSPNIGNGTVTLHKDPRILPVGHFLRKTKINELPQLFNIFLGDMSIIGPRPQAKRSFDAFSSSAQASIIKVKPGLSGAGSIVFRNEEGMMHANKNPNEIYDKIVMPYNGDLDKWCVDKKGIKTDFLLIALTVFVVLFSKSDLIWKIFNDMPKPPKELEPWI